VRFDKQSSPSSVNEGRGWTVEAAKKWLLEHDLHADRVSEESAFIRFRQSDEKAENFATDSTGMPEGVLLTTCDTPKEATGMQAVDGRGIKGKALSAAIESALPEDSTRRQFEMRKLAKAADVSLATIHLLVGGKLNCPTRKTLEKFAEVLDVPVSRLISAAKQDGCSYE
jgi:DNA-binding Xre family transcriptional regulator